METVIKELRSGRVKIMLYKKGKPFGQPMYAANLSTAIRILYMLHGERDD